MPPDVISVNFAFGLHIERFSVIRERFIDLPGRAENTSPNIELLSTPHALPCGTFVNVLVQKGALS